MVLGLRESRKPMVLGLRGFLALGFKSFELRVYRASFSSASVTRSLKTICLVPGCGSWNWHDMLEPRVW